MYPITPHICFSILSENNAEDASNPTWPQKIDGVDKDKEVEIIIQIDGKLRSKVNIKSGFNKEDIMKIAVNDEKIKKYLANCDIAKEIYVPNKLINFVTK